MFKICMSNGVEPSRNKIKYELWFYDFQKTSKFSHELRYSLLKNNNISWKVGWKIQL